MNSLVFMGSPDFALIILKKLVDAFPGIITGVITQPDKPRGRGKQLDATPVKTWALDHQLAVHTPASKAELAAQVTALNPDLIVVASYGMIIPQSVTDTVFCLNIHPSLLPRYRGATPLQSTLLNGDSVTGVTLMKMNEKMDAGDILEQQEFELWPTDNFGVLHDKTAGMGAEMAVSFIRTKYIPGTFTATPQNHAEATICRKINKADLKLDGTLTPAVSVNRVRAFSPKPGAFLEQNGKRIKILDARLINNAVQFVTVQPEGKKPMAYKDYCLGYPEGLTLC